MAKLRGNRIRARRDALGIRQEALARAAKVPVCNTINRFERNKGDARAPTLYDIVKVLRKKIVSRPVRPQQLQ